MLKGVPSRLRPVFFLRVWAIILLLNSGCAASQQATPGGAAAGLPFQTALAQRPAWIDFSPHDEGGEHFLVGLSEYHASEREAREDAMRHAREQFAQYTGVEVSLVDEVVRSLYGSSSGILDAEIGENSTARSTSDALVSRIKARQWYWEAYRASEVGKGEGVAYRYWVLVSVPVDEYERVQQWKQQKERGRKEREAARAAQLRQGLEAMAARMSAEEETEAETIAVAPVAVQPAVAATARKAGNGAALAAVVETLSGRLTADLHRSRAFQVVQTPPAAPRYRMVVEIDGFGDFSETTEYKRIGRTSLTRNVFLSAVVRIIETAGGTLVAEASGGRVSLSDTADLSRPGTLSKGDAILVDLAAEMARKLLGEAVGTFRPARVLAVSGGELLIDRGTEDGFRTGVLLELYAAETVRAPGSGAPFRNELTVGRAEVVRADARQSFAVCDRIDPALAAGLFVRLAASSGENPVDRGSAAPAAINGGEDRWMTPGSDDKPVNW